MKKRIIALMLAGVCCFSLTACSMEEAKSVVDRIDPKEILSAFDKPSAESEEDYQIEIPDAVKNISPEVDQAVTGVLTEDSYTNEYFGLKLNKIEDGIIESLLDDGTELTSLSESYANGIGIIFISTDSADETRHISVSIDALKEAKSEEELIQEKYDFENDVNAYLGVESDISIGSIVIAGEEHPAFIEFYGDENDYRQSAAVYIVKGDFEYDISFSGPIDSFDALTGLFEKI